MFLIVSLFGSANELDASTTHVSSQCIDFRMQDYVYSFDGEDLISIVPKVGSQRSPKLVWKLHRNGASRKRNSRVIMIEVKDELGVTCNTERIKFDPGKLCKNGALYEKWTFHVNSPGSYNPVSLNTVITNKINTKIYNSRICGQMTLSNKVTISNSEIIGTGLSIIGLSSYVNISNSTLKGSMTISDTGDKASAPMSFNDVTIDGSPQISSGSRSTMFNSVLIDGSPNIKAVGNWGDVQITGGGDFEGNISMSSVSIQGSPKFSTSNEGVLVVERADINGGIYKAENYFTSRITGIYSGDEKIFLVGSNNFTGRFTVEESVNSVKITGGNVQKGGVEIRNGSTIGTGVTLVGGVYIWGAEVTTNVTITGSLVSCEACGLEIYGGKIEGTSELMGYGVLNGATITNSNISLGLINSSRSSLSGTQFLGTTFTGYLNDNGSVFSPSRPLPNGSHNCYQNECTSAGSEFDFVNGLEGSNENNDRMYLY